MIKHCDVRIDVSITNLNAKEKKGHLQKTDKIEKASLGLKTIQISD